MHEDFLKTFKFEKGNRGVVIKQFHFTSKDTAKDELNFVSNTNSFDICILSKHILYIGALPDHN